MVETPAGTKPRGARGFESKWLRTTVVCSRPPPSGTDDLLINECHDSPKFQIVGSYHFISWGTAQGQTGSPATIQRPATEGDYVGNAITPGLRSEERKPPDSQAATPHGDREPCHNSSPVRVLNPSPCGCRGPRRVLPTGASSRPPRAPTPCQDEYLAWQQANRMQLGRAFGRSTSSGSCPCKESQHLGL